jgi:hypothetical protein
MQQPLHSIEGHAYQQRVAQEQQKRAAHSAAEQQQQQQQAAQYQEQYQAMVRRPPSFRLRADCLFSRQPYPCRPWRRAASHTSRIT